MNFLQYSNGWGHLVMSVLFTGVGLALILFTTEYQGAGIAIILTVQGAWFVSGSARQVATEVVKQFNAPPIVASGQSISVPLQAAPQTVAVSLTPTAETPPHANLPTSN